MNYKQKALKEIQEEESEMEFKKKLEQKAQCLVNKLENMTQEQRNAFFCKLNNELKLVDAEIKDVKEIQKEIKNRIWENDLSNKKFGAVVIMNALAFALVCGIATGALTDDITKIIQGTYCGGIASLITSFFVDTRYENKAFSNMVARLKQKRANKKLEKLNKVKRSIESAQKTCINFLPCEEHER